jgi:hypothetical protein
MAKVIDLSTYLDNTALNPEYMTGLVRRIAQGEMVAEKLMPVEAVPQQDFGYHVELDYAQFDLPGQKGEKGGPGLVQAEFEKAYGSTVKYYEGGEITADYLRQRTYSWVDKVGEILSRIAKKIQLGVENDIISSLMAAIGINAQPATAGWVNHTAAKPLDDIVAATESIQLGEAIDPDSLILYVGDYNRLILSDQIRATSQYIKNVNAGPGLYLAEIGNNIRFYPTKARYNAAGTLTPLLQRSGLLIPAGEVGKVYEFEPYVVGRIEDQKNQLILVTGKRQAKTVVTNPGRITIISGI